MTAFDPMLGVITTELSVLKVAEKECNTCNTCNTRTQVVTSGKYVIDEVDEVDE